MRCVLLMEKVVIVMLARGICVAHARKKWSKLEKLQEQRYKLDPSTSIIDHFRHLSEVMGDLTYISILL